MRATFSQAPSSRKRGTVPALAIVVVWSVFAIFCFTMATVEDLTRNARIGFYIGGAVGGLLAVLGLAQWILELTGLFDRTKDSDTQWKANGVADPSMRGADELVDELLELGGVQDEDLLEIRHGDTSTAEEQDPEEFGLLFRSFMKVIEFFPYIVILGIASIFVVEALWESVFARKVLLGLSGCVAIYIAVRRIRRYRSRNCSECRMPMELLSEDDEDAHLSKSEILEEKLNSSNYDVWLCSSCSRSQTVRYGAFFSRYSKCPSCGAKTRSISTVVTAQPTNVTPGTKKITESCDNCDYKKQYLGSISSTGS